MMVTPVSASPDSIARWIGAAPRPQQGAVDVQARLDVEGGARQDQAVGGHHHHVVIGGQQALVGSFRFRRALRVFGIHAQRERLQHFNAVLDGVLLDRRRLQLHAAAGRSVGLGQYQGNLETCFMQGLEGNGRKFRRAREDHFHASPRRYQ
jgi:hypothetical protein